jgi:putative phage-type endonuclease
MPELTSTQLASRRDGMGATDIVEVCGLAPWEGAGPWRVWNAKLGIAPLSDPTEEQRWGHQLERVIGRWYEGNVGHFDPCGESTRHPFIDAVWATLDGITPDRTIEIKNVGGFMCKDWDVTNPDGVPHYVRAQVQIGMACAERDECHVVASLAGRPPEMWTVRYDHALANMLLERAGAFWRSVLMRQEPKIDDSDACREYLQSKYPRDERAMLIDVSPDKVRLLDRIGSERAEKAARIKEDSASVRSLDSYLLDIIGPHKGYEGDGWKMTWKVGRDGKRRSRFTVKGESDE